MQETTTATATATIPDVPSRPEQRFRMTYEEYEAWVQDHYHSEWVDGEVTRFMSATLTNQDLHQFLVRLLGSFNDLFDLGRLIYAPFQMKLRDGRSYREPDILFIANHHLDRLSDRRLDGPADLVIEIVSPDSVRRDGDEKLNEYAAAGIPEYWLFDPRPGHYQATFYRRGATGVYEPIPPDTDGRLISAVLLGFWLDPAWFWQTPPPKPDRVLEMILGRSSADG